MSSVLERYKMPRSHPKLVRMGCVWIIKKQDPTILGKVRHEFYDMCAYYIYIYIYVVLYCFFYIYLKMQTCFYLSWKLALKRSLKKKHPQKKKGSQRGRQIWVSKDVPRFKPAIVVAAEGNPLWTEVQLRRAEEWARRGASGRGTKNRAARHVNSWDSWRGHRRVKMEDGWMDMDEDEDDDDDGGLVREIFYLRGNPCWWNTLIWPDGGCLIQMTHQITLWSFCWFHLGDGFIIKLQEINE